MRSLAILVVAALAACGPKSGDTAPEPGSGSGDAVAAGARGAIEAWRQAWEVRSVEALGDLYAHNLDLLVVEQGRSYLGWTEVQTYLSTKLGAAKDVHVKLDDVQVFALGAGAAAASASIVREISDGVVNNTERGVVTMALRAEADGAWKIVSEHYSYPPVAP
jgi:ketosteroid isomerase-like protein